MTTPTEGAPAGDTAAGGSGSDTLAGGSQETPGQKPGEAGTKGEQDKGGKPADEFKPHGAPENYTDFAVPEGMELDKALVEKVAPVLKELDLSQAGAQKLSDFFSEWRKNEADASSKAWNDTVDGWQKDSKGDKEFGGANYDASLGDAKKVLNTFLKTPAEHQAWSDFVDSTGVGEHPALTRLLVRIGKTIKDDNPNPNPGGQATELSADERALRLYPSMAKST